MRLVTVAAALAVAGCTASAPTPPAQEPEPTTSLGDQLATDVSECRFDGMRGTVTNNAAVTVDVTILLQWLDGGTLTDDATETVRGLAPGQEARWNVTRPATGRATDCTAEVRSAVAR